MVPSTVLSRTPLASERRNPFRIRFYANSACKSFRIRFYENAGGVGVSCVSVVCPSGGRVFSPFVFTGLHPACPPAPPFIFKHLQIPSPPPPFRPSQESNPCRSNERVLSVLSQHRLFPCDQFRLQDLGHAAPDHPRGPRALQCRRYQRVQRRVRVSLANEELILRAD